MYNNIFYSISDYFIDIKDEFYLNFIKDDRWKLLVDGLKNTLKVTLFAIIIGILLGFIIAIIRSTNENTGRLKILNVICKLYLTVIRGTPVMVQILIAAFVIFTKPIYSKIFIASIAFGLNSAAYVAEIVRSGIMSIDKGQFEAGRSLGLNYPKTMIYIILPQAIKNVLPALSNEFITLIKETSIAGYIGLTELTRAGDMIRGATFSALMPLIAVAFIYLILVVLLSALVSKLERRLRNSDH